MKRLIYPPDKPLDGPWLLSLESLNELDVIIAEFWNKFELRRERQLRLDVNRFQQNYSHMVKEHGKEVGKLVSSYREQSIWSRRNKEIEIYVKNLPGSSWESFQSAVRDRYLRDQRPTGFRVRLVSGDINFNVTLVSSNPCIEIIGEPIDVDEVEGLHSSVYEWARKIRHGAILQGLWGKVAKIRWHILIIGLISLITLALASYISGLAEIKGQLFALYEQGITDSNVVDAVKYLILLRREAQIMPVFKNPWFTVYTQILVYLTMLAFVRPTVELSIGKGRDSILLWRIWQWLVLLPPLFLVSDVFSPYLAEIVKNYLPFIP